MNDREKTIHDMCLTYRHDYELRKTKDDPGWISGMTEQDAKMLYKIMESIYDNNIEPLLRKQNEKN